jgi:adenosylcobinamide kinase / adenosylcobinamide-phosphate guanylyltransferase
MALTVLLGGARSGKSGLAVELAVASGARVTFIATGEARDEEMVAKIASHRAERPSDWLTVEEPYALETALAEVDPSHTVVLDCLTLWTANALARDGDLDRVLAAASRAAGVASAREALTVAVSNEVGLGIVPLEPLGRTYRDLLGEVNHLWVEASADAFFVVAGQGLRLAGVGELGPS